MTTATKPTLADLLKNRGILTIARRAGWQQDKLDGDPGWRYPVYHEDGTRYDVVRFKWAENGRDPKYKWDPPGQDRPAYYLLPGTLHEIQAAGGVVYLATGEVDNLTINAAGRGNVVNWFGENAVPKTLVEDLKRWGVKQAFYFFDLDDAGEQAAAKVEKALHNSGINLQVKRLPGQKPVGYDLNALWQECAFDPGVFWAIADSAEVVQFYTPPAPPVPLPGPPANADPAEREEVEQRVWAEIARTLEKRGSKPHYYDCPLEHGPDGKDFIFDPSTGKVGGCQGKHAGHFNGRWRDLADHLNVDVTAIARQVHEDHQPVQTPVPARKERVGIVHSKTALREVAQYANGLALPDVEPIIAPYKPLRLFGGFSHIWETTKAALVIADTGFGKTAFCETLADFLNVAGIDVFMRGQEWTPHDYQKRKIAGWGGPVYEAQVLNQLWHVEHQRGVRNKTGVRFTPDEQALYNRVVDKLAQFKGEVHHLVSGSATISHILEEASRELYDLRKAGRRVLVAMWDYAQKELTGKKGWSELELLTNEIAMWGVDEGIFNIIVSQVKKNAGDKVRRYGMMLDGNDAQMLTTNQAQVAWTLNPVFNSYGERVEEAWICCVKNSNAPFPARIRVKTALNRHRWTNTVLSEVVREVRSARDNDTVALNDEEPPEPPEPLHLENF